MNLKDLEGLTWTSQFNHDVTVIRDSHFPARLMIYDTTLRDGEQTIGVSLNRFEKLEIATLLEEAGVNRIEAGMPVVSREDLKAVQMIVNNIKNSEVWGFCRCVKDDINACLEAGVKSVVCEMPTSQLKHKAYNYNPEEVLERLVEHLLYAKNQGLYTAFFAVDATRTSLDYLQQVYTRAVKEGLADEVVLVDTLGVATPETMFYLARQVKSLIGVPLMVHCHNDFGLGTACTMAGVKGGAEYAHVTVNGLGEKTGNADLAEIALAAPVLYGLQCDIILDKLPHLSKRVAEISKISCSPLKPVVGSNIFKRETGVAVAQLAVYPPAVESYAPELVGARREVLLSKKSGKGSIEYVLKERGITASPLQIKDILEAVKDLGVKKGGVLTNAEFEQILHSILR